MDYYISDSVSYHSHVVTYFFLLFFSFFFWGGVSYLVIWCFEPSQPLQITSGLNETFIKRHIHERTTNKAEIRPEEQSETAGGFGENLWNVIQLKGT